MNKLENFLNEHEGATKNSYGLSLKQFFEWKKTDADSYIKSFKSLNEEQKEELLEEYQNDIKEYWKYIKQRWKPKYTRNAKLNPVRQLLIEYKIELPMVFWKRLKKDKDKGARALTQDRAPTHHELRRIIHEGKPIARSISLIAISTGMRLGEILQLKISDIDWKQKPVWINIRGETTKTGDPRTVYLTEEASNVLENWMYIKDENGKTNRDKWFETVQSRMQKLAEAKPELFKKLKDRHKHDDGTIFPITRQTAESYWQTMLKRANLDMRDTSTNLRVLHFHTLRKFFRSSMAKPLGLDVTEALMGHSGYLTDAYRRYSKSDLAKLFLDNQQHVTVIQEPKDVKKLEQDMDKRLQEKDQQMKSMQEEIQLMKAEILEMRLERLEKQNGIKK